ncbi:PEP-utilizing enzyme [Micromonospora sp. NPDC049114]|uniref:PEP-utilizing enzyme n=1 Tax=unclassified Micromonospora TaxID=2617518 RepID=UPI0034008EBC
MTSNRPVEYFRQHSALADWLRAVRAEARNTILAEDSTRSSRLELLSQLMGLPIIEAITFDGSEVASRSERFTSFARSAQGRYAVRAFPRREDGGQVHRNRNLPLPALVDWLTQQDLDLDSYEIEISQHLPNHWATIFVVNSDGVIGEIVRGSLRQLTQGGPGTAPSVSYVHDFQNWKTEAPTPEWQQTAAAAVAYTAVPDADVRARLHDALNCDFARDLHLCGYFEAIVTPEGDIRFIDYNISLGDQVPAAFVHLMMDQHGSGGDVRGRTASRGSVTGRARVVVFEDVASAHLTDGEVLVCVEPTPDMVPLLAKAGGLVADRGGVLSHASIVCRELAIPCLVGTTNATEIIPDGAMIEVNADAGLVRVLP